MRIAARHAVFSSAAVTIALASPSARADDATNDADLQPRVARDAKGETPIVAYTYSAYGSPARTYGATAYGLGLVGPGQRPTAGGGVTLWGSPIDRLTLVVDAPRDVYFLDHFAPSAAAIVRLLGKPGEGFSLGLLGKYKVEGFGTDPDGNTEHEVESGLLLSYVHRGLHLDLNAITGFGLADTGEIDTEGRLRFGYDLTSLFRVGFDAQGRYRVSGDKALPNGATADFAGGPQLLIGNGHVFGALTAGPATMGLTKANAVGWTAVASLGGAL
jgi:hypothetical protein